MENSELVSNSSGGGSLIRHSPSTCTSVHRPAVPEWRPRCGRRAPGRAGCPGAVRLTVTVPARPGPRRSGTRHPGPPPAGCRAARCPARPGSRYWRAAAKLRPGGRVQIRPRAGRDEAADDLVGLLAGRRRIGRGRRDLFGDLGDVDGGARAGDPRAAGAAISDSEQREQSAPAADRVSAAEPSRRASGRSTGGRADRCAVRRRRGRFPPGDPAAGAGDRGAGLVGRRASRWRRPSERTPGAVRRRSGRASSVPSSTIIRTPSAAAPGRRTAPRTPHRRPAASAPNRSGNGDWVISPPRCARQRQPESGTLAGCARGLQPPAVQPGVLQRDRQTQPGTAGLPLPGRVRPPEPVEDQARLARA